MTDATPESESKRPRTRKPEVVEDAVIVEDDATDHATVDETAAPEIVEVEEVEAAEATEPDTAPADTATPAQQVIYVEVPAAPKKFGNRGFGALIAVAASVVFTVLLAVLTIVLNLVFRGSASVAFLAQPEFYIPTLFFLIGFVLLVLIANRANWGAYIVGSIIVAVIVYFGTIGLGLVSDGIITSTPDEASARFATELRNPGIIGAALLAREVAMWTGILISRRGRRLKVRNADARETYDRELAEKRGGAASATAV